MIHSLLNGEPYKDLEDMKIPDSQGIVFTCDTALKWIKALFKNTDLTVEGAAFLSSSRVDPRIKQACSLISKSYKETIRLSDLASSAHLSESRFRHLFKQDTGISIRQYVLNTRIVGAVRLIIRGYSKTDAAHEAGFSDSAHLSRTFRRMYGLPLSTLYKNRYKTRMHLCPAFF